MTTYEKYLQWKAEQTSKAPSIKAFCDYLDNQNQPEEGRRDRYGLIKEADHVDSVCTNCIYRLDPYTADICDHCRKYNEDTEYYYAKPD
jgi:hypothetical protein